MENDFITIQEVARMMEKSIQTVRRMVKKGEISSQRVKTPQGFQYIVSRSDLAKMGYSEQKEMFSDSTIQTTIQHSIDPHVDAEKSNSTNQNEILISRTPKVVHRDAEKQSFDIQVPKIVVESHNERDELFAIIAGNHKEKIALYKIIEKMQDELIRSKKRKLNLWTMIIDFFS